MTTADYEYLARVSKACKESVDRPSGLWRNHRSHQAMSTTNECTQMKGFTA